MISVFLYIISSIGITGFYWLQKIPFQMHPLILVLIFLGVFIRYQFLSKFWLARTILNIMISPFLHISFRHFFLGDQLLSLAIVFYDLEFTLCYFFSDAWTGGGIFNFLFYLSIFFK